MEMEMEINNQRKTQSQNSEWKVEQSSKINTHNIKSISHINAFKCPKAYIDYNSIH